jgi:hypothetical protein
MWGDRRTARCQDICIFGFLTCVADRYKIMLRADWFGGDGFAPMTWHVYRLIDPRTGKPFYVGCTAVAKNRFQDHVDDPTLAARPRCRELRGLGLHPKLKIVRAFRGKRSAYEFACGLILTARGLVNAPLEFFRWPKPSRNRDSFGGRAT